jgi:hypothetical protein
MWLLRSNDLAAWAEIEEVTVTANPMDVSRLLGELASQAFCRAERR